MSVITARLTPVYAAPAGFHRWSVADYHRFIELGFLSEDDRVELLEGNLLVKPVAVLARGDESTFSRRHPLPPDIGLVVEVSSSSLLIDRLDKGWIYAQAGLPIYWITNVIDRQVEVYTDPRPNDPIPAYASRTDYVSGTSVPLLVDGVQVAQLPVDELIG